MSKRISDAVEATRIDPQDQILFLQTATNKTKRISRDNFAKSPGFGAMIPEIATAIDTTPPAIPAGLTVTPASSEIMADGTERIVIRAKINPNTEPDLASYSWYLRRASGTPTFTGGVLTGYSVAQVFTPVLESMAAEGSIGADGKVTKEWTVVANTYYEVRVAAVDVNDNFSDYTQLTNTNVILSAKDTTAPNAPTSVTATSAIRSVFVAWTNPSDKDLAYVKLFRPTNTSNAFNISSATRAGTTVTITTGTTNHGFVNGDSVTVVGLSGTVNPNGIKTVTVLNSTQFTFTIAGATGSETYTITNGIATLTSNVLTVFDGYADAFTDTTTEQGRTYNYWLTAVDFSGNESALPSNVARTTPGTVDNTDIRDFAVDATKMYNNTVVLENDSWTSNGTTFTITWNAHSLYYRGIKYSVASGSLQVNTVVAGARTGYVYVSIPAFNITSATRSTTTVTITTSGNHGFSNGNSVTIAGLTGTVNPNGVRTITVLNATQFTFTIAGATGSETYTSANAIVVLTASTSISYSILPVSTQGQYPSEFTSVDTNVRERTFMIATNIDGIFTLAWNKLANAVIGSAYIQNAAIDTAKVRELNVDKLSSGTITSQEINITGGGVIKSAGVTNFNSGQGFYLQGTSSGTTSRFGVGDLSGSGSFVKFDVNTLTVQGTIQATAGYFGGNDKVLVDSTGLLVGTAGRIASTADVVPGSGVGFYLGRFGGSYQFFVGNSGSSFMRWDNTNIVVQGTIRATSGYIGGTTSGWQITSGTISNTDVVSGRTTTLTSDARITMQNPSRTMTLDNSSSQGGITLSGAYPAELGSGTVNSFLKLGVTNNQSLLDYSSGLTLDADPVPRKVTINTTSPVELRKDGLFAGTGTSKKIVVGASTFSSIQDITTSGFAINVKDSIVEVVSTIPDNTGLLNQGLETYRMRGNPTTANNEIYLRQYFNRHTAGSTWDGVGVRLQHHVYQSLYGFIEFNSAIGVAGRDTDKSVGIGSGVDERLRINPLSVNIKDVNLRIYSGSTQSARIDYTNGRYFILGSQVLDSRKTGWTAATGTATRTSFDTSTVTTAQLAERVKALLDDLISHGLIGA